jgi:hypothetical protein
LRNVCLRCIGDIVVACDFPAAGHPYDPEHDGYVVLLERGEDINLLPELGLSAPLTGLQFEAVRRDVMANCFILHYFTNNQFGLTFILPDERWLSPRLRNRLLRECEEIHAEDGES